MRKTALLILALAATMATAHGQTVDSVDVTDYDISLDLSGGTPFAGDATLTLMLTRPCDEIGLELIGTVDSMWVDGERTSGTDLAHIPVGGIGVGQAFSIRVCYHGSGYVEPYGWGGMHFDSDMTYNLGVGFGTNPHPVGRAVFPCRDNFTDKATYTLRITARETWSAECSGVLQQRTMDGYFRERTVWRIDQPVCTYLVGISQAPYSRIADTVGGYPVTLAYTAAQDSGTVRTVFALLEKVVAKYEECFGPYRWHRIGYIPTERGSMEHVNNIALAYQAMQGMSDAGQSTIAHELGHAWFGNLVTCGDEGDMWINEGGASFCSEVAREATHGRALSDAAYQKSLDAVLRTAHIQDGSYMPLHGMPHNHTYGTTTYDKGALVWHSLRGYLGDTLFYASMRKLFERCAFGNLDAYSLRDSLSLYSGVNLDAFFDFHVFEAGFVDYYVTMQTEGCPRHSADVTVRQQGVGTDAVAHANRVPVTVVGWNGEKWKTRICFDGADTTVRLALPFAPAYCLLDADCELSDAATVDNVHVVSRGIYPSDVCHLLLNAQPDVEPTEYHIEHHWGRPHSVDTVTGVLRTAQRYWTVYSTRFLNDGIKANFRYVRGGESNSDYAELDHGFLSSSRSIDSVGLLWRLNDQSPWVMLGRLRSNSRYEGYATINHLRTGEYTLAVVDTNLIGIDDVEPRETTSLNLFPNPVRRSHPIVLDIDTEACFDVWITDQEGRLVWQQKDCRPGDKIEPSLGAGIYLVRIENNFISLQSKLIVI